MDFNKRENNIHYEKMSSSGRENDPVLWPSERIPQGGLFHPAKMEYSKETADLLKVLMQESRMSIPMRKQIDQHLQKGEPLPRPRIPPPKIDADPNVETLAMLQRARNAKRKSLQRILASGAYDKPIYRPPPDDRLPSDKAKIQLQEVMSGLRIGADCSVKPKRKSKIKEPCRDEDLINELLDQIAERADWLAEMEEMGEGRRYREDVRQQVAERLRQIKAIQTKMEFRKKGFRYIE